MKKCETCKWIVLGKFSRIYGGMPIGCNCPVETYKGKNLSRLCQYEKRKD